MTVKQLIDLLEENKESFSGTPYEVIIRVGNGSKEYNKLEVICTDTGICGTYVTLKLTQDNPDERVHYNNRKEVK